MITIDELKVQLADYGKAVKDLFPSCRLKYLPRYD